MSRWVEEHPFTSLVSCAVGTAILLITIGVPLHNLVIEQKDAKVEVIQEQLKIYESRILAKDEQIARYVSLLQEREA